MEVGTMSLSSQQHPPTDPIRGLIDQLETLRRDLENHAEQGREAILSLPPAHKVSAENLLHYLAFRSHDLRPLQDALAPLGLSSLGRAEAHVMATLDAVLNNLYLLDSDGPEHGKTASPQEAFEAGTQRLETNTARLFGDHPEDRRTHIMVTMPAEAATDYLLVQRLLTSGMNCMRINCSHDDPETWEAMIKHLRDAERATGESCRILMDLGGPKLRTGPMQLLPAVVKIRPVRNSHGHVLRHARIWLTADPASCSESSAADACIIVEPDWLSRCRPGDLLLLRDARDSSRKWRIREVTGDGCWAECNKTSYVENGSILKRRGHKDKTRVHSLPQHQDVIGVRNDDVLLIVNSDKPGQPALRDDNGDLLSPGKVSLPIPEVYQDTHRGETVCFDDGRISGVIEKKSPGRLQVRITHTRKPLEKLASGKGVNFPDTRLSLPALGDKDLQALEFAARHADMVGLSFANRPEDVRDLHDRLAQLGSEDMAVVLKIETRWGFARLPELILEAMKFPACGVMIARGDLAVECGFRRLAEVQQEMLWICEAAHVPVIWATQVLEGLCKRGHASRAEITDAANSEAAECVMLNKGPHVVEAVRTLDDILRRMQDHQTKKQSMLRKLRIASRFTSEPAP
jgi:pyruvate kinase